MSEPREEALALASAAGEESDALQREVFLHYALLLWREVEKRGDVQ